MLREHHCTAHAGKEAPYVRNIPSFPRTLHLGAPY